MSVSRKVNQSPTSRDVAKAAAIALAKSLQRLRPDVSLDERGYTNSIDDNLLPGVGRRHFEAELMSGDGEELKQKFRAAHSSSALVVNSFAPFKDAPSQLSLLGSVGFGTLAFEKKCPTGLKGKSPNLDLLAERDDLVVGIESKCTEYIAEKERPAGYVPFKPAYFDIKDERRDGRWFRTM